MFDCFNLFISEKKLYLKNNLSNKSSPINIKSFEFTIFYNLEVTSYETFINLTFSKSNL